MPLTLATPPNDAWATLQSGLQMIDEAQRNGLRGGAYLPMDPEPTVMKPLPVYILGLNNLAEGKGLETAQRKAWIYLLITNDQVTHSADVYPNDRGENLFGGITTGFASAMERGLELAERLPEIVHGTYEIRELRVLALGVIALWLKNLDGEEDRFIILPRVFPPFQALTPYTASELLPLLQKQAAIKAKLVSQIGPVGNEHAASSSAIIGPKS